MTWHLTGDYYVDSKGGSDITGDGSSSMPYATLQFCITNESAGTIIFNGESNETLTGSGSWVIKSDGYCVFDGTSTTGSWINGFNITVNGTNGGIEVFGYTSLFATSVSNIILKRVFMRDATFNLGPATVKLTDIEESFFYNCGNISSRIDSSPNASCRRSTFMFSNVNLRGMVNIDNNVFYECDFLVFDSDANVADYNCIYNNIVPAFIRHFEAGGSASQVPNSPFASLAAYQAEPTTLFYNDNSVDVDPQFNLSDSTNFDCTLSTASTVINSGSDGKQMGRYPAAIMLNANSVEVTGGTDNGNITFDANGDIYPTDPALFGQFDTTVIDLGALQNPMEEIVGWLGNDFSAGRAIDSDITDSNPKRVTVEFRYSTVSSGDVAGQTYKDFNWNDVVTLDASNRANGDPAYVISEATQQDGRWVQFRVSFDPGH